MTLEQYIKLNIEKVESNDSPITKSIGCSILTTGQVLRWVEQYNEVMAQLTTQPTPHKCPICLGMGHVGVAMISVEQLNHTTLSAHTTEPCKACKEGIIWK